MYPEVVDIPSARLERWDAEVHLPALAAVAREDDAVRFLGTPRDPAGQRATSERYASHWERFGFGRWAIVPDGEAAAGWAGAFHPLWYPTRQDCVELGWGLAAPARGRGLATLAASAAVDACFGADLAVELFAFVHPPNLASRAVAERLGMRAAGEITDPNSGAPMDVFALRRARAGTTPGRR